MDPFQAYGNHVNPALGRFLELTGRGTRFVRAQGASIEDADGNAYDDFLAGPPLIVSDEACARFVEAFADAIHWLEENAGEER